MQLTSFLIFNGMFMIACVPLMRLLAWQKSPLIAINIVQIFYGVARFLHYWVMPYLALSRLTAISRHTQEPLTGRESKCYQCTALVTAAFANSPQVPIIFLFAYFLLYALITRAFTKRLANVVARRNVMTHAEMEVGGSEKEEVESAPGRSGPKLQELDQVDRGIVRVMAKQSTLTVLVCLMLLLNWLVLAVFDGVHSVSEKTKVCSNWRLVHDAVWFAVLFGNCLCFALAFAALDNEYQSLCARCDQWLLRGWTSRRLSVAINKERKALEIASEGTSREEQL